MGRPETDLALRIRGKALELLMEKEPEEVSTRDISKALGVTATSLYYYYKDKEAIFLEVKLLCIEKLDKFILEQVDKRSKKYIKSGKELNPVEVIRISLETFRDWAFANPRIALLIMGRIKVSDMEIKDTEKTIDKYYKSYFFAKSIADRAVESGSMDSEDSMLDVSLYIAAIWGAIESVLTKRTFPKYWSKRGGIEFTDKMIDLLLKNMKLPGGGGGDFCIFI